MYFELVFTHLSLMVPSATNNHSDNNVFLVYFLTYVCYSTDQRWQIAAICLGFAITSTFMSTVVDELTQALARKLEVPRSVVGPGVSPRPGLFLPGPSWQRGERPLQYVH